MTLFITSCQVKEKTSDGGLISNHAPTTNSFTVQNPTSQTYVQGETITFNVSFPFNMIIDTTGGNPRLRITVGATTRYATYVAGADPRLLTFTYDVVASENDTNGVDVNALELNGSTLQFDSNGTITNCNVASVTTKNLPNVKVDTAGPTISAFTLTNLPGWYNSGENLIFTMTFSEAVYVTGTPKFTMTLSSGGPVDVEYISGSGTTLLSFAYTITNSDQDIDGINTITSPLNIGTDTLQDGVGNDANLDFSALTAAVRTYSAAVDIAGQYPFVVDVALPANGTYLAGQTLDFIVEFDRNVNVTGTPYIGITIGSTVRQAQYVSGTSTSFLTFRYAAVPGDVDTDGITVPTSITQNSGNIRDVSAPTTSYFGNVLNNVMAIPSTAGIMVNAVQPMATSATRNTDTTSAIWGTALDNKWNIGQELNVTIGFNTPITVTQTGGTPSIELIIGSTTVHAPYLSGDGQSSLIFRYIIQEGDLDTDGTIALGNISLNSGVLTDAHGTNVLLTLPAGISTTQVDGVRPTISSVTPPANGTYSNVSSSTMNFIINWSEAVNYSATGSGAVYIPMDVGGSSAPLQFAANNNTAAITHRPTTLSTYTDADGVTLSSPIMGTATIRDQAGNTATVLTYTLPTTTGILVDTTAPTITSVTAAIADDTYQAGDNLDFTVVFDESVTTNVAGGYPRIPITIGGTTRYLVPTANTTNTTHTFRYTVASGDLDTDGVLLTNLIQHNGTTAYARDAGQNLAVAAFALPNTAGILVDAVAPTVQSVSSISSGTYEGTDVLQFSITYSEAITVDTTGGTPRIQVVFDSGTVNFNYSSGSGTSTIVFSHTVVDTDYDFTGLPSTNNTIGLNGGTMLDSGDNAAPTSFTNQNLSAVYVVFENTKLWVANDLASRAPAGSPGVTSTGAASTIGCGSTACRLFDGDDSFSNSGALNSVETVFIVFRTPATRNPHNIFGSEIALVDNGASFDINTVSASLDLDGTPYVTNTTHTTNMGSSTVHVLQVDFTAPQSFSAGTLINTTYDGGIGEIMAVSGSLTNAQKTAIKTYLQNKY